MIYLWTRPEINTPSFYHYSALVELSKAFSVEPRQAGKSVAEPGLHVLMVPCRWLFENVNWFRGLSGPKLIVEHDAYLNFLNDSPWYRGYTRFYRATNFDLLISSGKQTTNKLREEGIPTTWVPKGCNPEFLNVSNAFNGRIGYFGLPILEREVGKRVHFYESRHEMSDRLRDRLPIIASEVASFPDTVKTFAAGVQNDATMGEPMAKHFECSAMGCAVIRDRQDELIDLGYVNHESMIMYDDFDEMSEMITYYGNPRNRDLLEGIQKKAIEVSRNQTWTHRAQQVFELAKPYLRNRVFI